MERKTKVQADDGSQALLILREFDLPVSLLFRAYEDAAIVEQWMGTKVLKLDNRQHGGYQFETSDGKGNVVFRANGTLHEFSPGKRIVRTFEMENTPFDVQLEFLDFEALPGERSRLKIEIVFRSVEMRSQVLKLPFASGISMAHDRLQQIMDKAQ